MFFVGSNKTRQNKKFFGGSNMARGLKISILKTRDASGDLT